MIRTSALAFVRDRRLLQARSHGKPAFYMAGGKIDPGESAEEALVREIREELDAGVVAPVLLDVFEAPAYGHAPGTSLHMTCFTGDLDREPLPTSEIAEIAYFTFGEYAALAERAPGSLLVFGRLHALGVID
ncbi:NUDIX domain-containing protein [Rhodococcus rhodnii]|uniref:NUDIX domain-containing protein n=1 Tax=Rhodococcus rhodnii TaxID=38312 RepID=A0A6P2CLK1_9NOCA|nr:NUDIX domain-containing protein [Rhodococcus rhodnii]